MTRRIQISTGDIQIAKQLREKATTATECRNALSVILPAKLSIDADQTAEPLAAPAAWWVRRMLRLRRPAAGLERPDYCYCNP